MVYTDMLKYLLEQNWVNVVMNLRQSMASAWTSLETTGMTEWTKVLSKTMPFDV